MAARRPARRPVRGCRVGWALGFLAPWLAVLGAPLARADEAGAWAALRTGGAIALMRHADAPGAGDPPGWRLEDCATQRNLGERGRADARAVGARLRGNGIAIGELLSSPWCRCLETARLLDLGTPKVEPTFANAFILADRREALRDGARALLARWRGPGVLLVVTHGENINGLVGRTPASGEIVAVEVTAGGALREIGALPVPAAR